MHSIECQCIFSTKVLIEDRHAKVSSFAGQREYLHFSVILRPWVLVRARESNPRPSALQSSALLASHAGVFRGARISSLAHHSQLFKVQINSPVLQARTIPSPIVTLLKINGANRCHVVLDYSVNGINFHGCSEYFTAQKIGFTQIYSV